MSERKRARERDSERVTELLRGRILRGIHGGHLDAGDRLPTYREVAEETGLDLRGVARVYRALEKEGLVEVRGRQGVFVPRQERIGGKVLEETARWMIGILRDALTRGLQIPNMPEFVRECTASAEVRCACIESTVDVIESICGELRRDFGFHSLPLHVDRLPPAESPMEELPPELRSADFLVTTAFHASAVRPLARALGKPLVVVRFNPDIVRELEKRVASGELTVICVDPAYPERLRSVVGGEHGERVRGILTEDDASIRALHRSQPVRITHAAHERLGQVDLPLILPGAPVLSPESAGELAELLVRFNLEAMHGDGGTEER